ncbi:MAG: DUF1667 domain-containing protein [Spirochaetales bacterium]|nr:DUF1667 domain-containing protein [Spirochaetales bacterium]
MSDKNEIICISCPIGCRLQVTKLSEEAVKVEGNRCNRGEAYGREETLRPKRTVTACVRTNSRKIAYAPVKTDKPLLKEYINELLKILYTLDIEVPLRRGEILIHNFKGLDVDVVFTRTVPG